MIEPSCKIAYLTYVHQAHDLESDGWVEPYHPLIRPDDVIVGVRGLQLEQNVTVGTLVDDLDMGGTLALLFVLSEDDYLRGFRVTYFV